MERICVSPISSRRTNSSSGNEIFELLVVDQVAEARVCLIVATFISDRSVFNHPTLGYILTAIAAPSVQGLAVEHGDPLASRRDTVAIKGLGLGGLRITNFEQANQFIKRKYRDGWEDLKL